MNAFRKAMYFYFKYLGKFLSISFKILSINKRSSLNLRLKRFNLFKFFNFKGFNLNSKIDLFLSALLLKLKSPKKITFVNFAFALF